MDFMKWSQSYWEEAARVQERMDLLYEMYLECRQTARLLEHRAKQERRGQR